MAESGNGDTDPNPPAHAELKWGLEQASDDARLLVGYCARKAKPIAKADMETLLGAAAKAKSEPDDDWEVEFWRAFQRVHEAVHPATAESIRASSEHDETARRHVLRYLALTVVVTALVLVCQVYFVVGRNLSEQATALLGRSETVDAAIRDNDRQYDEVLALLASLEDDVDANGSRPETPVQQESDFNRAVVPINAALEELEAERHRVHAELRQKESQLLGWLRSGDRRPSALEVKLGQEVEVVSGRLESLEQRADDADSGSRNQNEIAERVFEVQDRLRSLDTELLAEQANSVRISLARADIVLITLNGYLLPLLYGLLGAAVFILRSSRSALETSSFTVDQGDRSATRLTLGMLSGLFIGWFGFLVPGEVLGSVSEFALAFLVGYNVEVVFRLLEPLIRRVGRSPASEGMLVSSPSSSS